MRTPVGDLRKESLEEIWQGAEMKNVRATMLAGHAPEHCSRCEAAEAAGHRSLRQTSNEKFNSHMTSCVDTSPHFNPVYLDLRFSNLCNFRCRTCGPSYSSAWYSDARRVGQERPGSKLLRWGDWRTVARYVLAAEEINFAGGEPLISEDHYQIIRCILQGKSDRRPRLSYNTNLSTLRYKDMFFPTAWDELPAVRISVSIDAWDKQGEMVRKGKRWDIFVDNVRQLWEHREKLSLGFTVTVSVLNVHRVPQLLDQLYCDGFFGSGIHLDINYLDGPSYYRTQILPAKMKEAITAEFTKLIEDPNTSIRYGRSAGEGLNAVITHMNSQDRSEEIGRFLQVTKDLDRIRGEDTFSTFPELEPLRTQKPGSPVVPLA